MSQNQPARNLLLGILALQNNFIDRDGLLAAFNSWAADKSRSLGQVLLERGMLTLNRHTLLEALVEEHIAVHGDDPQRSLAALSSIGSVHEGLSRIADPDLQASLLVVSSARADQDRDPYRTVTQLSIGDRASAGTRFHILRPHAKGDLGQVSIALDQELDRPVALKEIQDRHADDSDSRGSVRPGGGDHRQARTPRHHPGLWIGRYADGRPFYAMRFISGDNLMEAIAAFHADKALKRDPGAGYSGCASCCAGSRTCATRSLMPTVEGSCTGT